MFEIDDYEDFCSFCHDERPCECDRQLTTEWGDWPDYEDEY